MTTDNDYVTGFMEYTCTFTVPAWTELVVFARNQSRATYPTKIHFVDAAHWMINLVTVGNRQIEIKPEHQRADHFSDAVLDGAIKLGVFPCAMDFTLWVTPRKDDLLFSMSLDGYHVPESST